MQALLILSYLSSFWGGESRKKEPCCLVNKNALIGLVVVVYIQVAPNYIDQVFLTFKAIFSFPASMLGLKLEQTIINTYATVKKRKLKKSYH